MRLIDHPKALRVFKRHRVIDGPAEILRAEIAHRLVRDRIHLVAELQRHRLLHELAHHVVDRRQPDRVAVLHPQPKLFEVGLVGSTEELGVFGGHLGSLRAGPTIDAHVRQGVAVSPQPVLEPAVRPILQRFHIEGARNLSQERLGSLKAHEPCALLARLWRLAEGPPHRFVHFFQVVQRIEVRGELVFERIVSLIHLGVAVFVEDDAEFRRLHMSHQIPDDGKLPQDGNPPQRIVDPAAVLRHARLFHGDRQVAEVLQQRDAGQRMEVAVPDPAQHNLGGFRDEPARVARRIDAEAQIVVADHARRRLEEV